MYLTVRSALLSILFVSSPLVLANDYAAAIENHAKSKVSQWLQDPAIINAIKAQNDAKAGITQAQIDALDKQWRAQTAGP